MISTETLSISVRPTIEKIEEKMLRFDQAECPIIHTFGPGLYIREVRMPKGALVLGHHQIFEQMNIFLKGKVLMVNDDGSKTELSAPIMFVGKPGRKMGYILEDVTWLNIYSTEERDVETLESTYLQKSETWKNQQDKTKRLDDNEDYKKILLELNTTEDNVRKQSEEKTDQIPIPYGSFKIGIFESNIEGRGVFATANIDKGELIAPARLNGKRTPVGRYVNHSKKPNAKMIPIHNDIFLVSTDSIIGCKGGQYGEEITTNYKQNVRSLLCQE